MNEILQYTLQGLAAGSFYALAALGLAIIFGVLGVVNFAHGACYMLGAVAAAVLMDLVGLNFWLALVVVPVLMFFFGVLLERLLVSRLIALDPLYNFLLTFGISLVLVDLVKRQYGVSGLPYTRPEILSGQLTLGALRLPTYQVFVLLFSLLVCLGVWLLMTRTRIGMIVRASTEKSELTRALGIDVNRWVTPVFGFGIALAGLAGVLAAPFRAITADMGSSFIIIPRLSKCFPVLVTKSIRGGLPSRLLRLTLRSGRESFKSLSSLYDVVLGFGSICTCVPKTIEKFDKRELPISALENKILKGGCSCCDVRRTRT